MDVGWTPVQARSTPAQSLAFDPLVQEMIDQVDSTSIYSMTGDLSGEWPATIGGSLYTIVNRKTYGGTTIQRATQYVYEHLAATGATVSYHYWNTTSNPNVIGTLPGRARPDDIILISAHLDNKPDGPIAPGADDNASGSVAVLTAAQILSQYTWDCTLRFVAFTGEEQGLLGSAAYAQSAYANGDNILGVLNLDMIAYNSDAYPYVELHVRSNNAADLAIADRFASVVSVYDLDLMPQLVQPGTRASDHASFWDYGYPAILAIEDFQDFTPYYHTVSDTLDTLDMNYYTHFVKAAVGTLAHMGCLVHDRGMLSGRITDAASGLPLTATVSASGAALTQSPKSVSTAAGGYFTMTLPAGTYSVSARADLYGYHAAPVAAVDVVTLTTTPLDLSLVPYPAYVLSGTVVDAISGAPLSATLETVAHPGGACQPNTCAALTAQPATGYYSTTLVSGTYALRAAAAGYQPVTHTLRLDGDRNENFVLLPTIIPPPVVGFASSSPDLAGLATVFTNTTVGASPITYTWDFGDGTPQVQQWNAEWGITHVYTQPGQYTAWLTATNAGGTGSFSAAVQIVPSRHCYLPLVLRLPLN